MNSQQVGEQGNGRSNGDPGEEPKPTRTELLELVAAQEAEIRSLTRQKDQAHREGWREGKGEWAEETRRWRRAYESVKGLLDEALSDRPDLQRLDQAIRGWVGKS